jgi:hypothetical protein
VNALEQLQHRKALLIAQADLQRLQLGLAWREIRAVVSPPPSPERALWARPKVVTLLKVALPVLGARRLSRGVRWLSLGLMALRAVRAWRAA